MPVRLMIAGTSVRAQVESALRAGYLVCALDLFADRDTQLMVEHASSGPSSIEQLSGLSDVASFKQESIQSDAGIVCGGIENRIELLRRLEQQVDLLGPDAGSLARLQDSVEVYELLGRRFRDTKVKIPLTVRSVSPELESRSLLCKKFGSSGGLGVSVAVESTQFLSGGISVDNSTAYFQERIAGRSISVLYVSRLARRSFAPSTEVVGFTEQLVGLADCGASQFQYCGSIGPVGPETVFRKEQQLASEEIGEKVSQIHAVGEFLAQQFGLRGVWGIDFVVNDEGVWPVDINARLTASAELYETQIAMSSNALKTGFKSVIDLHVKACSESEDVELLPWGELRNDEPGFVEGKLILFNRTSEPIKVTRELSDALMGRFDVGFFGSSHIGTSIADIPCPDQSIEPGHPMLTIRVRCKTAEEARAQVREQAERIYRYF